MSRSSDSGARSRDEKPTHRRHRWSAIERNLRSTVGPLIAGVDEVGRGPLAGPVVACAVIMPPDERAIRGVDDSKRVPAETRAVLAARIRERALALAVGAASVREIDRLNIYHATVLAMRRALGRLGIAPHHVIIDGKAIRTLDVPHTAVVGGDGCCYNIACASIVAKVTRDRVMRALAIRYPLYRWEHNVGYCTRAHLDGISAHGVTLHHRRSFLPVRQLTLDFTGTVSLDVDALLQMVGTDDSMLPTLDDVLEYARPLEAVSGDAAPASAITGDETATASARRVAPSDEVRLLEG